MFKFKIIYILFFICVFVVPACSQDLVKSDTYAEIKVKVVGKIELPKSYHEGLFHDGNNIWVCNGKNGKLWVVDTASGKIIKEIGPAGPFTESITRKSNDEYFISDWDEKKLYAARIENGQIDYLYETSLSPAHPAGAIWAQGRLYVITWTRGMGTRFDLLEIDADMNLLRKTRIKDIQEPSQIAWDGKNLWITSWFYPLVYKIDIDKLEIIGHFASPVEKTTGISWDGKYMWLTGTYSGLYKLEIQ